MLMGRVAAPTVVTTVVPMLLPVWLSSYQSVQWPHENDEDTWHAPCGKDKPIFDRLYCF